LRESQVSGVNITTKAWKLEGLRTILRAEQDIISKQCKTNQKKCWYYKNTKTKNLDSIGNIRYVQAHGSQCLAKTDEDRANVFCDYFSSVYRVVTLPEKYYTKLYIYLC